MSFPLIFPLISSEQKFSLAFSANLENFSVESVCRVSEPKEGVKPIIFVVIPVVTWQLDIKYFACHAK